MKGKARFLHAVFCCAAILVFSACNATASYEKTATAFLTNFLNAPDADYAAALQKENEAERQTAATQAVMQLLDTMAAQGLEESFLRGEQVMGVQLAAVVENFSTEVKAINLSKSSTQKQYTYTAVLTVTYEDETTKEVEITGTVRFDSKEKIEYAGIAPQALQALYQ